MHSVPPSKWCTQRLWDINLEQKTSYPYLYMWTSQRAGWHWFYYRGASMTSWMSESADEREQAGDQSLAECPSEALKDAERTLAPVMWLSRWGASWQGRVWGVKRAHSGKGNTLCTQAHVDFPTVTLYNQPTFVGVDSLMVLVMMLLEPRLHSGD